jgi:DNA-binding NarL/FixJ family response regulator
MTLAGGLHEWKYMRSILLVEDHPAFASVLARLLSKTGDLEVTLVAKTAEIALQHLSEQEFDLALIDVFLPEMSGITLMSIIHDQYPTLLCMMLSGHMLDYYVKLAFKAGARGYVLKDNSAGILEGIRHVLKGETYVSKELRYA